MYRKLLPMLCCCLGLVACSPPENKPQAPAEAKSETPAKPTSPPLKQLPPTTPKAVSQPEGFPQIGKASYYADKFHGKATSSGEPYDKDKLTAAHRTLTFGTKLKVTRVSNGSHVVVTVNDRGPHSKKRVIDLSRAAAEKIGLVQAGIAEVKLDVVK